MFFDTYEEQFALWKKLRRQLETSDSPLEDTIAFWHKAPMVNKHLEYFRPDMWPDPWTIIKEGKYSDLTISIMIGQTLKLTKRFTDSPIEIRTYVDTDKNIVYNTCSIDNKILNYQYGDVIGEEDIPTHVVLQAVTALPDYK